MASPTVSPASDSYRPAGDRRRHPREPTPHDLTVSVPIVSQGEVLDLNEAGALITSPVRLHPGDRARLSLLFGREPFSASVRVVRVEEGTRMGGSVRYHLGLAFTSLDDQNRNLIRRFVRREPGKA